MKFHFTKISLPIFQVGVIRVHCRKCGKYEQTNKGKHPNPHDWTIFLFCLVFADIFVHFLPFLMRPHCTQTNAHTQRLGAYHTGPVVLPCLMT